MYGKNIKITIEATIAKNPESLPGMLLNIA
jgi:hypothetical protein